MPASPLCTCLLYTAKKGGKKIGLRILAGGGVVVLGFGGGLLGTVAASRAGLTGSQVVVQQVQRDENATASTQGSTGGTNLSMTEIAAKALSLIHI